jgi:hypothetical protein
VSTEQSVPGYFGNNAFKFFLLYISKQLLVRMRREIEAWETVARNLQISIVLRNNSVKNI